MKYLVKRKIAKLEKQRDGIELSTNIEGAIDAMLLKAEIEAKIRRLKLRL